MSKVSVGFFFLFPQQRENNIALLSYYWLFRRLRKHCTTSYTDICPIIYHWNKKKKQPITKQEFFSIFLLSSLNLYPYMRQKYSTSLQVSTSHITIFERVISAKYYLLGSRRGSCLLHKYVFFLASMLLTEIRHYNKTNQGTHAYLLNPDLHRLRHRILGHKSDKKIEK